MNNNNNNKDFKIDVQVVMNVIPLVRNKEKYYC